MVLVCLARLLSFRDEVKESVVSRPNEMIADSNKTVPDYVRTYLK